MATASGKWWIADLDSPLTALAPTDTLEKNKTYLAFFVICDNDGVFDADNTIGIINAPISLTTTGELPDNGICKDDGGSSSGCTVGSTPSYDLLVLFLGMSAVAAIRVLRRRNEQ